MESERDPLMSHVLLPVAHPEDATTSATALKPFGPDRVTAVHVVEKAGGAPDKTPVEHSKEVAQESFEAVRRVFPDADEEIRYSADIVEGIIAAARDLDASVIAFHPRGGSRLVQLLAGDMSRKLIQHGGYPVLGLPEPDT